MKKFLWVLCLVMSLTMTLNAADEWSKLAPLGSSSASDLDSFLGINNEALDRYLQYGRHGCKISYASASTITVGAGSIVCSNSDASTRHLRANTSATTVTWANIDTGAEAISTTYYLWAIADADATTFTVMVSLSNTAPTGATYYCKLGSFYNDSSGNITQITNDNYISDYTAVKGQGNYYKIDSGTFTSITNGNKAVSFSFTFASAPIVICNAYADNNHDEWYFYISSVSTTGFNHYNRNGSAVSFSYIAIGQVLAQ